MSKITMGIYIHIPFCVKKCNYCDFLSFAADDTVKSSYVKALISEIKAYGRLYGKTGSMPMLVASVFFGGGTPSILDSKYIHRIMSALYDCFDFSSECEITVECNPGTMSPSKLLDYHNIGINRLSIGLQSSDNNELKALGRIHSYEAFIESFKNARKAGFNNINIDIMSALPGQTVSSYKKTLERVLSFDPEHISAYSLIIEEGTEFFNIYDNYRPDCGLAPLPDEDTEREMYYMTCELLEAKGLNRYEISNYSRNGFECKHNLGYWSRLGYLGFGIGAASFVNNIRLKNISDIKNYIDICADLSYENNKLIGDMTASAYYIEKLTDKSELITLSINDEMAEYMYLGLRKIKGVSIKGFSDKFGRELYEVYGNVINKHIKYGLMTIEDDFAALTKKGLDVSNYILSDFIL